ncbi:hypothetical protein TTHERM_000035707 (macronuclear) [Tetrahymena thermophila SB210]|uniref:Uncharacterized protein n=1 Tax=Tetrahymena thermophila (strain SB210) TaxID=312017 RepID=W7XKG5_TETTS|nr:hypothetical protein TTHERM_000035707 [Tetrahymena thermophila SB210]EWS74884.1 hypothetical protein TTHERM_000035707 [Tetrahymena thermophila SB210]|eukprot:XP_012652597.1 hypothetical protein TTHERM_000035707 [Tetrahymena thermophila SB210]
MISLQSNNAINSVISIFLDVVAQQIPQNKLNSLSTLNYECDSCFLKELNFKKISQDSCFQSLQCYQEPTKQSEDYDYFEERIDSKLKQNQQQNIIKNILKSFLSYLVKLQDSITKQKYQQMYFKKNNNSFSEIKKAVSKKVNVKTNRWNFQLRSLLQSESLKLIFYDYLFNNSQQWLQKSKVFNLEEHKRLIDVLLNCIENNQPLDIKIYKKKK